MKFHEFGDKNLPPILLIHGGGSSWWNYLRQARILSEKYRVILPTLNGHGEEYQFDYVSTEASALEILDYIKEHCGGKLFAIGGVSLGGQIAMELLSLDSEIAEKAIIDGSHCIPQSRLAKISIFLVSLFGKLMFSKFSCKLQLSMMNKLYPKLAYPEEIKDYFLEDLPRTPIKTLVTIYKTYMECYKLKDTISASKAQVLYIYGEKELNCVKTSAKLFQHLHPNTTLYEAKGYHHGYLSTYLPQEWVDGDDRDPYNSFGNGSAMRVSPCAWVMDCSFCARTGSWPSRRTVARLSAEVTHNHPEGVKGAMATSDTIFMCRYYFGGYSSDYGKTINDNPTECKRLIKEHIEQEYGYNLSQTLDEIRPTYRFNETCQNTVPQAIIAFLESTDFEDYLYWWG